MKIFRFGIVSLVIIGLLLANWPSTRVIAAGSGSISIGTAVRNVNVGASVSVSIAITVTGVVPGAHLGLGNYTVTLNCEPSGVLQLNSTSAGSGGTAFSHFAPGPGSSTFTGFTSGIIGSGSVTGGGATFSVIGSPGSSCVVSVSGDLNDPDGNSIPATTTSFTVNVLTPPTQYTLSVNTSGSGSATGAGSYNSGTVVNIGATPAAGWQFVNWTGDAVANANSANTTITMNSNKSVTANFSQTPTTQYTLAVNTAGSGSATGAGPYNSGTVANISATPAVGWQFVNWTGDAVANATSASTTITMNSNKSVTANFSQTPTTQYTLAVNTAGSGSATGGGSYNAGTVVNLRANPSTDWVFDRWEGEVANPNSASTTVTMDASKTVKAYFTTTVTYNLTLAFSGQGTTSPFVGTRSYDSGYRLNISANPSSGWVFDRWEGDVANATEQSTVVTMNTDKTVTAVFVASAGYTLTMAVSGQGTTNPSAGPHSYSTGQTVNISATPATGWQFVNWTGEVATPNSASTTVTMNASKTVTAVFAASAGYTLTLAVSGQGTTSPSVGPHSYSTGQTVNISATPAAGWQFVNWTGEVAAPNSASTTVTMNASKTVTAVFVASTGFTLTMAVSGQGTTNPSVGPHSYALNAVVTITATPAAGYKFDRWVGAVADPTSATTSVTIDGDKQITAQFVLIPSFKLIIKVSGSGTTEPVPGTYNYPQGTVVSISAKPDTGHKFTSWTGDTVSPVATTTTVLMNADKTVTANFAAQLTPPKFIQVSVLLTTRNQAVITWETDNPATGQVEYWPNNGNKKQTQLNASLRIRHTALLEGLEPGKTYNFIVIAIDEGGNKTTSLEYSFATDYNNARFIITNWNSVTEEVNGAKEVTISLVVANTGDLPGSYELTLKVNGTVKESKYVTLEALATANVSFTTTCKAVGTYAIEVNGFKLSVEVAPPIKEPIVPVPSPLPGQIGQWIVAHWLLVLGIVSGIILLGALITLILRRFFYVIFKFIRR